MTFEKIVLRKQMSVNALVESHQIEFEKLLTAHHRPPLSSARMTPRSIYI